MENGTHAVYFDNSTHGDDRYIARILGPNSVLDAVFDGVSGGGQGAQASELTERIFREASRIEEQEDVKRLLESAHSELSGASRIHLTTATVALKVGNQLYVINVGDSPAYLFRDGRVEELTVLDKDPYSLAMITQAIGDGEELDYHENQVSLEPGNILVLATDGITDNIYPDEFYERTIKGIKNPEEALGRLEELLKEKERNDEGREDFFRRFKSDDRAAIIRFF